MDTKHDNGTPHPVYIDGVLVYTSERMRLAVEAEDKAAAMRIRAARHTHQAERIASVFGR